MPAQYNTAEDLDGYIRGAHRDGEDVCPGFVFHLPGSSSTADHKVWGWNDTDSFYCERCKRHANEHIVLKEPKKLEVAIKKERMPVKAPPPLADATAANPGETTQRRAREAEQAAFFNAGYDPSGMLNEMNDPLAVYARPPPPKPKPPPPPLPPPPVAEVLAFAAAQPEPTAAGDLAEGVQDPALQELLARDAIANEAFKREVERMVRDAARKDELDARALPAAPPPTATAPQVADSKDLSGSTVPFGHFADAAALLESVSLPQYIASFNEEEMDPDTLIEVLQQQGKASLEEALKELGVKSMGHRLKIINSMIIS